MKILHIGKYYPPFHGGMEIFLRELVRAQAESGLDVRVLAHNHLSHTTTTGTDNGIEIVRVGCFGTLFFTPMSPAFRYRVEQQISLFRPDIIHLHMPNPSAFWVMTLAAAKSIPWVIHWHADVVSSALDWRVKLAYRVYRPMEQSLLKRSRAIIVTSPPYLESSQPLIAWRDKCRIIPLGMKDQPEAPLCTEENTWNKNVLRVLAIGRLTYYKGFNYLIRAAGQVDAVQVNLVGDGEKYGELQHLIRSKGLKTKVKLLGKQSGTMLSHLLQSCHCLCLPSIERTEAFGMVLLEAARESKTAVVSDVTGSGMSWVVENGKTGMTVPAGNAAELAAALRYLAMHKAECTEMGRRARKRFDTMFRIEKVEKQVFELYKDIALPPP
ncbi:glycosyltransferase [Thiolapillus sp.]